jgi:hypothetical protein
MRQTNRSIILAVVVTVVCLWHVCVDAAMYQCTDRSGRVSFTNAPASQNCHSLSAEWGASSFSEPSVWRSRESGFGFSERFSTDSNLYDQYIRIVSLRYGIDPYLIKAIIRTESDFDHNAISRKGAQGLMQLMPGTARDLNVINPFNPRENIDGGVRYLRTILDSFDGNLALSLAAYNAGPNLVKRVQRIPAIPETVEYVKRVLYYYKGYKTARIEKNSLPSVIKVREMVTVN